VSPPQSHEICIPTKAIGLCNTRCFVIWINLGFGLLIQLQATEVEEVQTFHRFFFHQLLKQLCLSPASVLFN